MRPKWARRMLERASGVVVVLLVAGWSLAPALWQVLTALKPDAQITRVPTVYLPDPATAEQQAWAHLYEMVQREALALSFIDNFWRLVWIFAAVIPFVLFLGRRPRVAETPADVERPAAIVEA